MDPALTTVVVPFNDLAALERALAGGEVAAVLTEPALTNIGIVLPDDGYLDLAAVMKALRKVGFNGAMVPDHVPQLAGDTGIRRAGTAYCIACMRNLLRRANEEVG